MKHIAVLDFFGGALSLGCMFHCALTPFALILFPALSSTIFIDEVFHQMLIWFVLPTSLISFSLGCHRHRKSEIVWLGCTGLGLLALTAFFGHDLLGETGEKLATFAAGLILAKSHFLNYRECKKQHCCNVP